jgi:hypothetical protein
VGASGVIEDALVVVVLPASMCAMIPMFRIFSRGNLRGM